MTDVATLIDQQTAAVDATMAQAESFLNRVVDTANVQFGSLPFNVDTLVGNYGYAAGPALPNPIAEIPVNDASRPMIDTALAVFPTDPDYAFSTLGDIIPPDFGVASPVLALPTAPSAGLPTVPVAPSLNSPDIPVAPTVSLPAAPTFAALALPTPPSITLPAFSAALPTDDLTAPTAEFSFYEAAYSSTLLDPLKAKLLADLTNGGYGIETADEVALFNRARDREVEAALTRIDEAGRAMATRGFPLPPGELSLHIDAAWQEMQDKVSSASRDITLERSKLYVDNRRFTIEQTREVEQILIGFHNSVQERALNAARATVELTIAVFKALVERFNARLDSYKSAAAVFEAQTRAELVKADIYRTEVEAKNVEISVQRNMVEAYVAQLRGITTAVDIYRTQMEAANIFAGIERTKLEAFRAQVEAYSAQVQAKVAEFGLFRAQVEGEKTKIDIFDAQVRAYNGQVSAKKIEADVRTSQLQSEAEQVRAKVALFQGKVAGYEASLRAQMEKGRLETDIYRADVEANRNDVVRAVSSVDAQTRVLDMLSRQNTKTQDTAVEAARLRLQAAVEAMKIRTAATNFAADKFFALLTAMESSVNTLAVQSATD